ncbi:hypothetical protein FK518_28085, partial [Klebsiella pneumoniae]|nr:hypothetical protein [Klebsiella pneumoniae]
MLTRLFFFFSQKTSSYVKNPLAAPPPSYTCFRCGKPGHYIKNCPAHGVRLWGTCVTELLIFVPWHLRNKSVNAHVKSCFSWGEIQSLYGNAAKAFKLEGKPGIIS